MIGNKNKHEKICGKRDEEMESIASIKDPNGFCFF